MSERYPESWRAACLELLKERKHELHSAVGYKKMSWDPICKEIIASLSEFWGQPSYEKDERISRQNLHSWENGSELKDEKFALIDLYVRSLALNGKDVRALEVIRNHRFQLGATTLASLYMRSNGTKALPQGVISDTPWTLVSGPLQGFWFRSIIIRAKSSHAGVVRLIVAYLPTSVEGLNQSRFDEVVFFEGFLLPMEIRDEVSSNGEKTEKIICSIKLVRPEFRGLSGIGYADGELQVVTERTPSPFGFRRTLYYLDFPSSVICPVVAEEWEDLSQSSEIKVISKMRYKGDQEITKNHKRIRMVLDGKYRITIDKLFNLSYRGFVK